MRLKSPLLATVLLCMSGYLFAQKGVVNFSKEFQKANQGKAIVEINEVKELIHIMIAITTSGLGNDDLVEQQGSYYQDILKQFKPYKDEKIISTFDSCLQDKLIYYVFLTGNAIAYDFDKDTLKANNIYLLPANEVSGVKLNYNPITTYKKAIEEFAVKSGFRAFYAAHKDYYKAVIADYEKNANVRRQWKWLENNFITRINSYQILCSPLINGLNYTGKLKTDKYTLIQMVLPPIMHNEKWTAKYTEVLNTRGMFTEIDHNYVGPPSDKNVKVINEALKDREKWVNTKTFGTEYYPNPEKVFNEYMTFAVFILYCEDIYKNDPEILKLVYNDVNSVMSKQRGFVKMTEFSDKLLELRKKNRDKKIDDLYPELLKWCAAQ